MNMLARIRRVVIAAAVLAPVVFSQHSVAQTPFEPAAVVNDDVITRFELDQRLRARAAFSGAQISPQMATAVLNALIAEKLRVQAATNAGISVSEEQLAEGVDAFARRRGLTVQELNGRLKKIGVTPMTVRRLVETELAWIEFIRRRYGSRARVSDADVERELNLRSGSEIDGVDVTSENIYEVGVLAVATPANASASEVTEARATLTAAREEIRNCDQIASRAEEFGPGSGVRSDLKISQLPKPLDESVAALAPGQFTDPVRLVNATVMALLCSVESSSELDQQREELRRELVKRNFERYAEGYLQELTRDAVIEIR